METVSRLFPFVWPYRRMAVLSVLCAVVISILWAGNLSTVLPMVRVLFQQKNLHQYVDEQIDLIEADIDQRKAAIEEMAASDVERRARAQRGRGLHPGSRPVDPRRAALVGFDRSGRRGPGPGRPADRRRPRGRWIRARPGPLHRERISIRLRRAARESPGLRRGAVNASRDSCSCNSRTDLPCSDALVSASDPLPNFLLTHRRTQSLTKG